MIVEFVRKMDDSDCWPIILAILIMLITLEISVAQHPSFNRVATFEKLSDVFTVDKLGNIYTIERGTLTLHKREGGTVTYSNRQFGPVTSADVTDPLNIVAFFGNFGNVVLLDNNLAEKKVLRDQSGFESDVAAAVCFSAINGYWAWFPALYRLVKFNFNNTVQASSTHLSANAPDNVMFMVESGQRVFLAANGIWVFDIFANPLFTIPHIQTRFFQVSGNTIFFLKNNQLIGYDFFLEKESVFLLPEKNVKGFFIFDPQTIYLQTSDFLGKYVFEGNFF